MTHPWFITGLPRSRTAWFAAITGAEHEPQYLPQPWVGGVSDSGRSLRIAEILHDIQPRTLIIQRPRHEVMASMRAYVGDSVPLDWEAAEVMLWHMEKALKIESPLVKRVRFDDLNDIDVVRSCLNWLQVNARRDLPQMMHMVVSSSLSHNIERLKKEVA